MKGVEVWTRWGRGIWLLENIWQARKEHEGVGTRVIRRSRRYKKTLDNPPDFWRETASFQNTLLSTWARDRWRVLWAWWLLSTCTLRWLQEDFLPCSPGSLGLVNWNDAVDVPSWTVCARRLSSSYLLIYSNFSWTQYSLSACTKSKHFGV